MQRIVVVGGGIAGLTLAAALDPARFEVELVEAQPERVSGGAALGLWPSARRALAGLGVLPATGDGVAGTTVALHDLAGRRLASARGPDIALVDRPALMAALERAVPPTVRRRVAEVEDPSQLDADLVVGADGVRSRVRGLVDASAADRVETPYVALRGILPSVAGGYGEYWGAGRLFGLAPMPDGRAYWFSTHRSTLGPEPLPVADVLAEARQRFDGAASTIRDVLADPGEPVLATRLWVAPPMTRYARGRYVVLGDAAHASLPNLGRGACDAILDAAALARTLDAGRSLASWRARRLPPTQAARLAAGGLMRLALLDRGQRVRDGALARLGALTSAGR